MSADDSPSGSALDLVIGQADVLITISDLQFANLGSPTVLISVTFEPGGGIILTARRPDGTPQSATLTGPAISRRTTILDLMGWSPGPTRQFAPSTFPDTAAERQADLLRDLGSNCSALVDYRSGLPPLQFAAITFDDAGCDITLRDRAGNQHRTRYDWEQNSQPASGELYWIVDHIADAR